MISQDIKEATKVAHQQLEKTVVYRLKEIRSEKDYATFLTFFYAYFNAVEQAISPYITTDVLADYADRRNSTYLKRDIEELGGTVDNLPQAVSPAVHSAAEAMGALYVLEGSIMGGPHIVQMLRKYGISRGFSFYSGYGADTAKMWGAFTAALNAVGNTPEQHDAAIAKAAETFSRFEDVFNQVEEQAVQ